MARTLVSDTFVLPEHLRNEQFQFEMLAPEYGEIDYDAVMSSRDRLTHVFSENDRWPRATLTLENNIADLQRHEAEFKRREAFAYAVFSADKQRYIGCVYLFRSEVPEYDCKVYLWVRDSEFELDAALYKSVNAWLGESWEFSRVAYPGRDIAWADWAGDERG